MWMTVVFVVRDSRGGDRDEQCDGYKTGHEYLLK
jgi:hypothetical protein